MAIASINLPIVIVAIAILSMIVALKKQYYVDSLKDIRVLVTTSFLVAINLIVGMFTIQIGGYLQIGFGFLTGAIAGAFFGPVAGGITCFVEDVLGALIMPKGPFLIVMALGTIVAGMIYGIMLYKKKPTFLRVLATKAMINVFVNIVLNSLALIPAYGIALLPSRIIKNIALLPIEAVILFVVLNFLPKVIKKK